ncbi:glycosyl transferase [Roseobacter cerasinus]|uniref:Glycosyl transferase n=1 Tax=Roseobacter cerasinus TaxID=2602289 RepID=A0A640VSI6_9RHOB|nr:glycosyltransferase [Roseobacter cerasinus]GFE50767.1 glycosyl transferase [Roseobacter cerasinus]
MTVAILVTHLLGTGHLARALTLARAFAAAGHRAIVLSGGRPVPHLDATGVRLVQLPPLQSDGVNFTRLLDDSGADATAEVLHARQSLIAQTLRDEAPQVLITELFPFGRRVLRDEFLTAVEAARSLPQPALVCASIRDILAPPSKPAKAQATDDIIDQHYDAVLVHSDAEIAPLGASWPVKSRLATRLRYTGFVASPPAPPHADGTGFGEVLVSAGGGGVGAPVFEAALDAARASPQRNWRLLVGGSHAADRARTLATTAPENARVEPARPDFRQMLHHAEVSVSMAGYNTALDLLQTGTPAVLVPFDVGGEVEQTLRATALARLPGISVLRSCELSGATLLSQIDKLGAAPRRAPRTEGLDGAAETVRIVQKLLDSRDAD